VFLNRRAAVSIIPGKERFSWNLSFSFSKHFFMNKYFIVEIFLRRIIFLNVSKSSDPERPK